MEIKIVTFVIKLGAESVIMKVKSGYFQANPCRFIRDIKEKQSY